MLVDESPSNDAIKPRMSLQSLLQPIFVVTPPTSLLVTARNGSVGFFTHESSTKLSHPTPISGH